MRKSPGLCTAERLLHRLASIFPAAAFLALAACSTDSKPDKPEKIAIAAPPAVLTFESAKSLVAVASSDTIWNGIAISDNDPNITSEALAKKVTCFFNSPTCGGTTIDAAGNLCVTDANEKRILKVTPAGQSSVPVQDPRLIWADAL
ncbi:hypothetical protein [Hymenobacter nivis]|uniref:SMP-30/Gluconolactonase/LRE-like region domain-containing protein n=1 Tax=Hymenobacter nivis TaxID=1850093 RepID=A0A2Z3GG93_9BACT|nr:hypothetical protein [Hymenobacter nivis]AWM31888.1 hypothetical protein DDQ68_03235 [Hymenobacter nivis]